MNPTNLRLDEILVVRIEGETAHVLGRTFHPDESDGSGRTYLIRASHNLQDGAILSEEYLWEKIFGAVTRKKAREMSRQTQDFNRLVELYEQMNRDEYAMAGKK